MLFVDIHRLHLRLAGIVFVFNLQLLQERLDPLHLLHRLVAFVGQRPYQDFYEEREDDDNDTIVADHIIQQAENPECEKGKRLDHRPHELHRAHRRLGHHGFLERYTRLFQQGVLEGAYVNQQ